MIKRHLNKVLVIHMSDVGFLLPELTHAQNEYTNTICNAPGNQMLCNLMEEIHQKPFTVCGQIRHPLRGRAMKCLRLEHEEVGRVAELMKLTPNDKANIVQFSRGSGMLLSNNVKILVRMVATDLETKTFTTDLNVKKKIRQEESGKAPGLFDT